MRTRHLLPLVLALALGVAGAPAASGTGEAGERTAPTCQGQRATLVGTQGRVLRGTRGDDVIVSNGATSIAPRGGDDLVCLTGTPPTGRHVVHDTGGDDVVLNLTRRPSAVGLGPGADVFVGGPAGDSVTDADAVRRIDTRAGADRVVAQAPTRRGQVVRGGPGRDSIELRGGLARTPSVSVDNRRGVVRSGSGPAVALRGFERFDLSDFLRVVFVGGDADEEVLAPGAVGRRSLLSADLGGGDDRLGLGGTVRATTVLRGGTGRDRLSLVEPDLDPVVTGVDVDLPAGRVVRRGGGYRSLSVAGFDDLVLQFFTADVVATDGDTDLEVGTCRGTIDAGGGDDEVTVRALENSDGSYACNDSVVTLLGGAGDDVLVDGLGGNVLLGGDGTDSADGGPGTDRCQAETTVACEPSLPRR